MTVARTKQARNTSSEPSGDTTFAAALHWSSLSAWYSTRAGTVVDFQAQLEIQDSARIFYANSVDSVHSLLKAKQSLYDNT